MYEVHPELEVGAHLGSRPVLRADSDSLAIGFADDPEPGERLPWFYGSSLILLALSVPGAVMFLVLLVRAYESYQHDKNSYTATAYSLNGALGFSGLICFAFGCLWLAFRLVGG